MDNTIDGNIDKANQNDNNVDNRKATSVIDLLSDMLDFKLRDRVASFSDDIMNRTSRTRSSGTNTGDDVNDGDIRNLNDDNNGFFLNDNVIVLKTGTEYNSIPKMVLTKDLPSNLVYDLHVACVRRRILQK